MDLRTVDGGCHGRIRYTWGDAANFRSLSVLSLIRKIGTPAFTFLAGALIVVAAVLLVTLLDLLLKGVILPLDQLIGGLVALALGPVVVFLLVLLMRRLDRAQHELQRANECLRSESAALRALSEQLARANQKLDFAQRVAKVGYYEADLIARTYDCSPEFDRIFGFVSDGPHDLARLQQRLHPDDRERYREHLQGCLQQRHAFSLDYRILRDCDAEERWVYGYGTVTVDDQGQSARLTGIVQDITERKRSENELREMRDRLQLATEAAEFGVWDWDLDGAQIRITPRINALCEWDLPSVVEYARYSDSLQARIHPADREAFEQTLDRALHGEAVSYSLTYRIVLPGERIRYLETHARIHRGANGSPLRVIGVLQDRTALKETENALAEARDRAEASSRAKSEFVANMSHEIRTPLNAVMGITHLLRQTALDSEQSDYLDRIGAARRSLLGVLNDILYFSKIEAGRIEVSVAPFVLRELLGELAAVLSVSVGDKPVEILIGMADDVPQHLVGDMLRLRQVLINLAGNAVKFTEQGEVTVWVERLRQDESTVWCRFSVRDTGIGMSREQQRRLFVPFTQADASTTRRFGGTGLGLTISKRLVELMGGTIDVQSQPGAGSEFWFSVPLAFAQADQQSESLDGAASGISVLVADDHPTARIFIRRAVEHLNWWVDMAGSGEEAVALFRRRQQEGNPYDVVLLDWKMPGLDGIQTSRAIRLQQGAGPAPIVLLVTAHACDEAVKRDAADSIDGILMKPVTCQALLQRVTETLRRRSRSLEDRQGSRGGTVTDRPLVGRHLLLVEDNSVNQLVARRILQHAGATVDVAEHGRQAVERLAKSGASPYDLVLMDVQMPVMDGLTATRWIREQLLMDIPIVAMSAGVMPSERQCCLDCGMNDFLGKPFGAPEIIRLIQRHCRPLPQQEGPRLPGIAAAGTCPAGHSNLPEIQGFDLVSTLQRFGGDRALLDNVLALFGEEFRNLSDELCRLRAQGDFGTLQRLLHKFRGSAANLGGVELCRLAQQIESSLAAGRPCDEQLGLLADSWRSSQPYLAGVATADVGSATPAGTGH